MNGFGTSIEVKELRKRVKLLEEKVAILRTCVEALEKRTKQIHPTPPGQARKEGE